MSNTITQYDLITDQARKIFGLKTEDYGTAWRILRPSSLTDQLFIKASRIRSLQEKKVAKINESTEGEFQAIINYSIMAMIQIQHPAKDGDYQMDTDEVMRLYNHYLTKTKELMLNKNHDYGEAWREMRVTSITDLVLAKLLRIKQIEENDGQTIVSEGLESNYQDILNYAVFALILLEEKNKVS